MKLTRKAKLITLVALAVFVVVAMTFCVIALQQNSYAADMGVGLGFVKVYMEPIFPNGQNKLLSSDKTVTIRVYAINEALDNGVGVEGISYFIYWNQSVFDNPVYSNEATSANGVYGNLLTYDDHLEGTPTHGSSDFMGKDIKMFDVTFSVKDGVSLESNAKYTFRFAHEEDDIYEDQMVTTLNWDLAEDGLLDSEYNDLELEVEEGSAPVSNTGLSVLTVGGAAPTGGFTANSSTNQTVTFDDVPYSTTSVEIVATPSEPSATVSGDGTWNLTTAGGENTTTVTVSHGGRSSTYTLKITRGSAPNTSLSALTVDGNNPTDGFTAGSTDDQPNITFASVPYSTSSVTISATASDSTTTLDGAGTWNLVVGENTRSVTVAKYGRTTTYTLKIVRGVVLSSLSIKDGSNNELLTDANAFVSTTTSYSISVPYATDSVTCTVVLHEGTTLGSASGFVGGSKEFTLFGTSTPISITVYSGDNATSTEYTITVTREAASSDNTLSAFSVKYGDTELLAGDNAFSPSTTSYNVAVPYSTTSLTVTATKNDSKATADGDTGTIDCAWVADSSQTTTTISVSVTAEAGGTPKVYTVTVTRGAASTVNTLSALSVAGNALDLVSDPNKTDFTISVPYATTSLNVTATPSDSKASVTGDKGTISFASGDSKVLTINVTSESNSTKIYTVTVTRAKNTVAQLSSLSVKDDSNSELLTGANAFSATKTTYSINVPYTTESVSYTAAVIATATADKTSGTLDLDVGANTLTITVTAQDKTTTATYTVTINRASASTVNTLSTLSVKDGATELLTGENAFSHNKTTYTVSIPYRGTKITVAATASEFATVTTDFGGLGDVSIPTSLNTKTLKITVTPQSGEPKEYTITVNRAAPSTDNNLSVFAVSYGSTQLLTGENAFSADKITYSVTVPYEVVSIKVSATKSHTYAIMTGDVGTISFPFPTTSKTISVNVEAESGATKTYTVNVTRAAPSDDNTLKKLTVKYGATTLLDASNASSVIGETHSVDVPYSATSITVTAESNHAYAEISETLGTISFPLTGNTKNITITVEAQNGGLKIYTITVTREPNSVAALASLSVKDSSGAELLKGTNAFSASKTEYTLVVPRGIESVNLAATAIDTATLNSSILGNKSLDLAPATNAFNIIVTAQNGTTTKTYTVTIKRSTSETLDSTAELATLTVTGATISPAFNAGTTSYTATVGSDVTSVTVGATAKAPATVASGTGTHNITTGSNVIAVKAVAEDGTERTYTVTITRESAAGEETKALLTSLTVDGVTLSPSFAESTTHYTATVANSISSVTVHATAKGGATVTSGTGAKTLSVGSNTITVVVTEGTATRSYTIAITRSASETLDSTALLDSLTVSGVTLNPAFNAGTTSYTATVPNGTQNVTVTATAKAPGTVVSGNGATTLNIGSNVITIKVVAEDGSTARTYTVTINRESAEGEEEKALLDSLSIAGVTLSPTFAATTTSYTATVANGISSVNVSATAKTGATVTSGNGPQTLSVGSNTITVVVTEGETTRNYTITISRAAGSALDKTALLESLTISNVTLNQAFNAGTTNYTATVANAVDKVKVTATAKLPATVISGNGETELAVGSNPIIIKVVAESGAERTYTVTITRESAVGEETKALLANLSLGDGITLSPAFASTTTSYTATVANGVESVNVTPTPAGGATVTEGDGEHTLVVGINTIVVKVAEDTTTRNYTVVVTKSASATLNSTALLESLTVSNATLSPAFSANTTNYTANVVNSVEKVTVTALAKLPGTVTSGNGEVELSVGANTISITVVAEDGTETTYTVIVNRSNSNTLSNVAELETLTVSNATLSPSFNAGTTSYTATVGSDVTSVTVGATAKAPATVASGTGTHNITTGSNVIAVKAVAEDGTERTYTVTITRESAAGEETKALLRTLSVDGATLSPSFAEETTTYTATVANGISSVTVHATAKGGATVTSGTGNKSLVVGINTLVIVVTEGETVRNYTIVITRSASATLDSTALLDSLNVSNATLDQAFNAGTTNYTATVGNSVDKVTVTATAKLPASAISGNGEVELSVGSNVITIKVVAEDGTERTYTVTITRQSAPGDTTKALLRSLSINGVMLSPSFAEETTSYTATVANGVDKVTVNAEAKGSANIISGDCEHSLAVGANTIVVEVGEGSVTRNYTIVVTRSASATLSSVALLDSLTVSSATLSPSFNEGTTNYTATVANTVDKVTVTATAKLPASVISGNGEVELAVGSNVITIKVVAEDGTEKTHTVTITRMSAPGEEEYALLSSLTVTGVAALNPSFAEETTSYTATVPNGVSQVTVTAVGKDGASVIAGDGVHNLDVGVNTITVTVEQGSARKNYTITITRSASATLDNTALLDSLTISNATLSPAFNADTTNYTATVTNNVNKVTVTAMPKVPGSVVSGNGEVELSVGANTISITVVAEDGTSKTYTVVVTRSTSNTLSNVAELETLTVSNVTLSPSFNAGTTSYTAIVGSDVTSVTVGATAKGNGSLVGNGEYTLAVGSNVIVVKAVAEDGTERAYTVTITRACAPGEETKAQLLSLSIDGVTISPSFAETTTSYTATVPSGITSVTINAIGKGAATVSGTGSKSLVTGVNVFTVVVTEGETTRNYTITITQSASATLDSTALLDSLNVSNATLDQAFNAGTANYTATVGNNVDKVTVTAAAKLPGSVVSGNGEVELAVGSNVITIKVVAEDGTERIYTVTITRECAPGEEDKALLIDLSIDGATLSPNFAEETTSYTATVASGVENVTVHATAKGVATVSGDGEHTLAIGVNTITVTVTEGTTSRNYTIVVTRSASATLSGAALLESLEISDVTLSPAFNAGTTNYTATVANGIDKVTVTAVAKLPATVISGNGEVELSVGSNVITIKVVAEDGTERTYVVTITRMSAPGDEDKALLSALSLGEGITLSPSFSEEITNYTATVASGVDKVKVDATAKEITATVSGDDNYDLAFGVNVLTVVVTEGSVTRNYTITVTRSTSATLSSEALLESLVVGNAMLSPAFNPTTTAYTAYVTNSVNRITITATAKLPAAVLSGNGEVELSVGANIFTITVVAEDGTERIYRVTVTRSTSDTLDSTAELETLDVFGATLDTPFNAGTTSYTATVENDIDIVNVNATAKAPGIVLYGTGISNLAVGSNAIAIKVVAEDGTERTYTVTITRKCAPGDESKALLSSLSIEGVAISPSFNETTTSYTAIVPYGVDSITINATGKGAATVTDGTGVQNLEVGVNVFKVEVTEGSVVKNYSIVVTRSASATLNSAALLDSLVVSNVTLAPTFNAGTTSYTATVANNVNKVTVTATAKVPAAVVSGNGEVTLNVGSNVIAIKVVAEDGTERIYTVTITRECAPGEEGKALLSSLSLGAGITLSPSFSEGTTGYTATVPNSVSSVNVSATGKGAARVTSGAGNKSISVGLTVLTVRVEESGTVRNYTIAVTRSTSETLSSAALLESLEISNVTLSPAFNAGTTNYTATVASSVDKVTITAVAKVPGAVVFGNGETELNVGSNVITIKVVAEDGTIRTYTVTITRLCAPGDEGKALLSSLSLGAGITLSPSFSEENTNYTATVTCNITDVNVTAEAKGNATVTKGLGHQKLATGLNIVTVEVTEGNLTRNYTVRITRSTSATLSSEALLENLVVGGTTISPAFNPEITTYTARVANSVTNVTITATAKLPATVLSGNGEVTLQVGPNIFTITVVAEDGTIRTYTVIITRLSSNVTDSTAELESLTVSGVNLSPVFNPSTLSYYATVDSNVSSVTINATAKGNGAVNGTGVYTLATGSNVIAVTVVAEDGSERTYTVTLTRPSAPGEEDKALLSSLTVTGATISPTFASETTSYKATVSSSVASVTINATASDGSTIASGTGSKLLAIGVNIFTIVVKEGNVQRNYTVTITRSESATLDSAALLESLEISNVQLNPVFNPETKNYTVTVANSVNTVTVTANAQLPATVTSGNGELELSVGTNVVAITVVAEDGTEVKYVVAIIRENGADEDPFIFIKMDGVDGSDIHVTGISMKELLDAAIDAIARSISVEPHVDAITVKTNPLPATTEIKVIYQGSASAKRSAIELGSELGEDGVVWTFDITGLLEGKNVIVYTVRDEALNVNNVVVLEIWKPFTGVEIPAIATSITIPTAVMGPDGMILKLVSADQLDEKILADMLVTVTYADGSVVTGKASDLGVTVVPDLQSKTIKVSMEDDDTVYAEYRYQEAWNTVVDHGEISKVIIPTAVDSNGNKIVLKLTSDSMLTLDALKSMLVTVEYTDGYKVTGKASELGVTLTLNKDAKRIDITLEGAETVLDTYNYEVVTAGGGGSNIGLIISMVIAIVVAIVAFIALAIVISKLKKSTNRETYEEE